MWACGLQDKGKSAPAAVRALFAKRLLKKVAEAYGRMLLIKGLFQADCHPGNILIREDNDLGAVDMCHPLCWLHCSAGLNMQINAWAPTV